MVYYKSVKITIDISELAKVIIDIVVCHYDISKLIVIDQSSLFLSKFWSLLCYFLKIKKKLFTAFYLQTDDQTERQKSTIEVYLRAFIK